MLKQKSGKLGALWGVIVGAVFFAVAVDALQAQALQPFYVAGDGAPVTIPLNASEYGKEYTLIAEIKGMSAVTASVTLAGPFGVVGTIFTKAVSKTQSVQSTDLNLLNWQHVNLAYDGGKPKYQIITGEDPTSGGTTTAQCPPSLSQSELNAMLVQLQLVYGPSFTMADLCELLGGSLGNGSGGGSTGNNGATQGDGETPVAYAPIPRDSCSKSYRYLVQFRINTSGLPQTAFTGLQNITATLKLKPATPATPKAKVGSYRFKISDGIDAPWWILLFPAIGTAIDKAYGAPGTDTLYEQFWSKGKVSKQYKGKTRILFGDKLFMINKDPVNKHLNGKRRTYMSQNGPFVNSFCFHGKRVSSCSSAYKKATGINCKVID
ncbi:MAG: hypothetical protein K1X79_13955 [Oligoflexia bacterium]|nr:hypothetical protein [Oligoflexia bacterium]